MSELDQVQAVLDFAKQHDYEIDREGAELYVANKMSTQPDARISKHFLEHVFVPRSFACFISDDEQQPSDCEWCAAYYSRT